MKVAGRKIVVSTVMPRQARAAAPPWRCSTPRGDLEGVGAAELLDDQHDARAVVDDRVADQRPVVDRATSADVGQSHDLARPARRPAPGASSSGSGDRLDVADVEPLSVASRRSLRCPTTAPSEYWSRPASRASAAASITCSEGDVVWAQLRRVDLDVPLREPLAPDGDLGNAGHAQQPRADLPVGDRGQSIRFTVVGRQPDLHDPARRRQRRHHERRARPGRQGGGHLRHPLGHELPGAQLVGAAVEDERDRGQLGHRLRAQLVQALDARRAGPRSGR